MFCRACESPAAVYNIENGQPNRSEMETSHSGRTACFITVSPVPGKYALLWWRSPAVAECVQTRYGSSWS